MMLTLCVLAPSPGMVLSFKAMVFKFCKDAMPAKAAFFDKQDLAAVALMTEAWALTAFAMSI
jgi:hypothetical protein